MVNGSYKKDFISKFETFFKIQNNISLLTNKYV